MTPRSVYTHQGFIASTLPQCTAHAMNPWRVYTHQGFAVLGGRAAKTTKEETLYHRVYVVKVSTAMKDALEADH